ncbi:Reticulon-domain-containing protein [Xylaria bambusicola]|uniref:Reticulon-domain-containing protein n=1 Tax=Xylaria bambusicola TaxID=326684 RepID=UPI0020073A19|nr:Reticulon-domain-containing protein [Xylaria bambusicola]KAI0517998.1 Reticulon-domain-containing protein [Xylaria bambusicola]
MGEPTYVVMPIRADGSTSQENDRQMATAIEESLHERLHPTEDEPAAGPLKKAIAHQDSLYKYISWEDPARSIGSYLGIVALMYGVHYLHWGQWLLKMGATALGVMSLASFASHSTRSDFVGRMRPEYKTVPEPTLNATLKDIHDFVQYLAIQGQKILYGEDLSKTFGAFLGLTGLFWLAKILTPFDLEVLGLSSVYLAPLILSPKARETAQCAKANAQKLAYTASDSAQANAQDLTNSAAKSAKGAVNDVKAKSADISSRSQEAAGNLASGAQQGAKNLASSTQQTASDLSSGAQGTAGNLALGTQKGAKNLASNTQQGAKNLASSTQQAASSLSSGTQETVGNLASGAQQGARNVSSSTQQGAKNLASGTQQTASNLSSGTQETVGNLASGAQQGARNVSSGTQQTASSVSSGAQSMAGNLSSGVQRIAGGVLPEKSTARNSSTRYEQPNANIQTRPADVVLDDSSAVADRFAFQHHVQKD